MELTIDQALMQGVAAHKAGNVQEAERLYQAILQSQPKHPYASHNLGLIAISFKQIEAALPLFKTAVTVDPDTEQFWISYVDALVKAKSLKEAKRVIKKAKKKGFDAKKLEALFSQSKVTTNNKVPPQSQVNTLLECYQNGRFGDAQKLAISVTQEFPQYQFAWKVLGAIFGQAGKKLDALNANQTAVGLSPEDAEAHNNLGNTQKELGRLKEARVSFSQAIALRPHYAEAHSNLGNTQQELGRLDKAKASFLKAVALKPDYAGGYYNLGNVLKELGELDEAQASYKRAIILKSDFAEAHYNLGNTLQELSRLDEAQENFKRAVELKLDYAEAHSNLGNTYKELGRLDEAEASYWQAIEFKSDYAEAHNNLGNLYKELGRLDEAEASYLKAIALKPDYAEAHRHLAIIKQFAFKDEHYCNMWNLYIDENTSDEQRCHINFGLAKASEDLGDYQQAYSHYTEGNLLRKKCLDYHISEDSELFKRIESSYQQIAKNSRELNNLVTTIMPIFIVGMPRSGTTLVEQIISSLPEVTGAGELSFVSQFGWQLATGVVETNENSLLNFRESYLENLQSVSQGNSIVTDKMPQNFRFIGLLAAAFPDAKIVHVKRDPVAVCWANYKEYFVSNSLGYPYALKDVVAYFKLYENLMEFWGNSLKERIFDLDYELLVNNQEREIRKLIHWLDLDWDEKCLSPQDNTRSVATTSNLQIRKKIYQGSSHQWKQYEPFLNGALDHVV
jgi:tetratricopeptide (TPR) repeat protein